MASWRPLLRSLASTVARSTSHYTAAHRRLPSALGFHQTLKDEPHWPSGSLGQWLWFHQSRGQTSDCQESCLRVDEARRFLKQANIELLKKHLLTEGHREWVNYDELIRLCRQTGVAASGEAAMRFVQALDDAGVVLIFRGKVFLHPEEIAEKVGDVLPSLPLFDENSYKEFELLHKELKDIDAKAWRQARTYLWMGLLSLTSGTILFFRLTFWELSWDVMEPIAFFVTTGFLIASYAYFVFTHRDPSYLGMMHSLLSSIRKRLMKKRQFNYERYKQLESLYNVKPSFRPEKQENLVNVH